jgi:dinuclear metal center YbgI/SA1388 family protein
MHIEEVDTYFRGFLQIGELEKTDSSLNGLQVARRKKDISTIAFAVDACQATFERAAGKGADMLFVHHGLFWGAPAPLTGILYERLHYLIQEDLALYAVHLPLDMHPTVGNNAGIAKALELEQVEPFGVYKGTAIGCKGVFKTERTIDDLLPLLGLTRVDCLGIFPFGPEKIKSVGIVSGGAAMEAEDALREHLDLFITGDLSHTVYHFCQEGGLNLISAGHYQTEIWGVRRVAEKTAQETELDTFFIDVPTGL